MPESGKSALFSVKIIYRAKNLDALAKVCLPPYDRTILRRFFFINIPQNAAVFRMKQPHRARANETAKGRRVG